MRSGENKHWLSSLSQSVNVLGLATCVIHIFKNFNAASTHWLFCLRQLISVIVDCHANKSPADILGCF